MSYLKQNGKKRKKKREEEEEEDEEQEEEEGGWTKHVLCSLFYDYWNVSNAEKKEKVKNGIVSKDRSKLSAYIFALYAVRLKEEVVIFFSFAYPFSRSFVSLLSLCVLSIQKKKDRREKEEVIVKGVVVVVVDFSVGVFERAKKSERNRKE